MVLATPGVARHAETAPKKRLRLSCRALSVEPVALELLPPGALLRQPRHALYAGGYAP